MSNYPQSADVFVNKTGADNIASSDPNNAFDAIETTQGLIGALGEPQTWSTTLMTLIRKYKRGMQIDVTNGVLLVKAGECVLENTDGSKFAFRKNSSDTTLTASNIDVGSIVAATYYIYATAEGAATTTPLMFSTDSLAPSGIGTAPYRKLGWFSNFAAGVLTPTYSEEFGYRKTISARGWIAASNAVMYQAATDIFIRASAGAPITIYEGPSAAATANVFYNDAPNPTVFTFIIKNNFWQTAGASTVKYLPVGDIEP